MIIHWNGASWAPTQAPERLFTVWGTAANDVWAAGGAVRWNGTAWVDHVHPGITLTTVWESATNDGWAGGATGSLRHWNGAKRTTAEGGSMDSIDAISGAAANDVWAVGARGTTLHWDGNAWNSVESGTRNELKAVWSDSQGTWASRVNGTVLWRMP